MFRIMFQKEIQKETQTNYHIILDFIEMKYVFGYFHFLTTFI